jgi:NADPH-dependent 2,4-dienoyl-CoA reductase/sulfur reductase-like enzyme
MNRRRWLRMAAWAAAGAATGLARIASAARARTAPRVLVAGGGFAGAACALELRRLDPGIDVRLIDPVERYATCPMSNEVIVGWRAMSSIEISRRGLVRAGVRCITGRVDDIDAAQRRLRLAAGDTLPYDRLVVAPGIRFLWERIEGSGPAAARAMPHAWQAGEQTSLLANQLRAMADGGVVAISVPAGFMRCPPGPYERASLIAHYLTKYKPRSKILILDANNYFPKQPLFSDAWSRLYPNMIEWIPLTQGGTLVRVDTATMTLFTENGAHRAAVANVIPPQAPGELAPATGLASDHGWCPVDPRSFESTLLPNVHVIGDACIADAMPKSASAALSQAQHCARAIAAALNGQEVVQPAFDSVCYGRVSPEWALSFPGHFTIVDGRIVASPPASPAGIELDTAAAAAASHDAERWYTDIRARAFAA